jgi:hypothetical protein
VSFSWEEKMAFGVIFVGRKEAFDLISPMGTTINMTPYSAITRLLLVIKCLEKKT